MVAKKKRIFVEVEEQEPENKIVYDDEERPRAGNFEYDPESVEEGFSVAVIFSFIVGCITLIHWLGQ